MGVPGLRTSRLARRLCLDGNPLRRRTDKIATCLGGLLFAVFLVGAPMVARAVIGWVSRVAAAEQQATRSSRRFLPWCRRPRPASAAGEISWGLRPGGPHQMGKARAGQIPVSADVTADQKVRLWVDAAGTQTGPSPSRGMVVFDEVGAAAVAVAALGLVLLCLACGGRLALDRRRLASWEAAWAEVGPRWTKRFRSRG